MKLIELEPKFLRIKSDTDSDLSDQIEGADGILFLCPKCFAKNGSAAGVHSIMCWQPHVPQSEHRVGPGRWKFKGSGFHDLSLDNHPNGASSVQLPVPCQAHFHIQNGEVILC